jgi:hypothetical protein
VDGVYDRNEIGAVAVPVNHAFGSTLRRQVVEMSVVVLQRLRQRLEDINRNLRANWIGIGVFASGRQLKAPVNSFM